MKRIFVVLLFVIVMLSLVPLHVSATDASSDPNLLADGTYVLRAGRYRWIEHPDILSYVNQGNGTGRAIRFGFYDIYDVYHTHIFMDISRLYYEPGDFVVYNILNFNWNKGSEYRDVYVSSDVALSEEAYLWLKDNLLPVGFKWFLDDLLELFDTALDWLSFSFGRFVSIFWTSADGFTFIGVFCLFSVAFALFFLLFSKFISFLRWR